MKTAVLSLVLLVATGCGRQARKDARELDALLTSGAIDRIEFLEEDKTNVLSGQRALALTRLLAATNRVPRSTWTFVEHHDAGIAIFYNATNRIGNALHYLSDDGALQFGQYRFVFKGTNKLNAFFE